MDSRFADKEVNRSDCRGSNHESKTSLPQCVDVQSMWYKAKDTEEETFFFRLLWSDALESSEIGSKSEDRHPVDPFLFLDKLKEMLQAVLIAKDKNQIITEDQIINFYRTASRVYSTLSVQVCWLNDAEDCTEESTSTIVSASIRKSLKDDDMILEDEWTVLMLIMTTKRWDLVEWFLSFHSAYAVHFLLLHRNPDIQSVPALHCPSGDDMEVLRHNNCCNGEEPSENSNMMALVLPTPAFRSSHRTGAEYPLLFLLSPSPHVSSSGDDDVSVEDSSLTTYQLRIPVTSVLQALFPLIRFCMKQRKKKQFTANANNEESEFAPLVMTMKQLFCSPPCSSRLNGDLVIGAESILELLEDLHLPQYLWNQVLEDDFHGSLLPVCEMRPPDFSSVGVDRAPLLLSIEPQNVQRNYHLSMWLCTRTRRSLKSVDSSLLSRSLSNEKIAVPTSPSTENCRSLTKCSTSVSHDEIEMEYLNAPWYSSVLVAPLVIVPSDHPFQSSFFSFATSTNPPYDFRWMMDNCFSCSIAQANVSFRSQIHLVELVILSVLLSSSTLQAKEILPSSFPSATDCWRNFIEAFFSPSLAFLSSSESRSSIRETSTPEPMRKSHSSVGVAKDTSTFTEGKETHEREGSTGEKNFRNSCRFLFSIVHTVLLSAAVGVGEVFRFHHLPISPTSATVHENDTHLRSSTVLEAYQWVLTMKENIKLLLDWMGNVADPFALALHLVPAEKTSSAEGVTSVCALPPGCTVVTAFYHYLSEIPLNYSECFSELWLGSISWKDGDDGSKFHYRVELFYCGMMERILMAAEDGEKGREECQSTTTEMGATEGEGETMPPSLLNRKVWWDALIHWVMYWKSFLILLYKENVLHLPASFPGKELHSSMHAAEESVYEQKEKRREHMDEDSESNSCDTQDDFVTAAEVIQPVLVSLVENLEERLEYGSSPLPALYQAIKVNDEPAPKEKELTENFHDHDHLHSLLSTTCTSSLEDSFEKARLGFARRVDQVDDAAKLCFYGLYKQATEGDISIEKPWVLDRVGRSKWNAWNQRKGLTKEDAMTKYVGEYYKIVKDSH